MSDTTPSSATNPARAGSSSRKVRHIYLDGSLAVDRNELHLPPSTLKLTANMRTLGAVPVPIVLHRPPEDLDVLTPHTATGGSRRKWYIPDLPSPALLATQQDILEPVVWTISGMERPERAGISRAGSDVRAGKSSRSRRTQASRVAGGSRAKAPAELLRAIQGIDALKSRLEGVDEQDVDDTNSSPSSERSAPTSAYMPLHTQELINEREQIRADAQKKIDAAEAQQTGWRGRLRSLLLTDG